MGLIAADELRHASAADFNWRESLYFNFNDPVSGVGGWIYLWVTPNKPMPSGMLVSLYKGRWPEYSGLDDAMRSPGHRMVDGERWLYCFKRDVEFLIADDFDDVSLCGLRLRRTAPLSRYELSFADDDGNGFEIDARFMTPPYDYAAGLNPSPPWVAANRYHRPWWAKGRLRLGGQSFSIDCTGDSDHSWGLRDMDVFSRHPFRMWSFQSPDGAVALSAIQFEIDGRQVDLGFVASDGEVASISRIDSTARYDADGAQEAISLSVTGADGVRIDATFERLRSFVGMGGPPRKSWGYEGIGDFVVDGRVLPGLTSYFWPDRITPTMLHSGDVRER
jgi:hypothetical protein